jgi:hypothetical protein
MTKRMKLKPPSGWSAVLWDLAIVTVGVLIALAGDRWAEERTLHRKVEASQAAIRDELAYTYAFAVEYRTTYPCVQAQVRQLLTTSYLVALSWSLCQSTTNRIFTSSCGPQAR